MKRGRFLFIALVGLALAVPAMASDHGIPQLDPRSHTAWNSFHQRIVETPSGLYWVQATTRCEGLLGSGEICIFGPIDVSDFDGSEFVNDRPDAPLSLTVPTEMAIRATRFVAVEANSGVIRIAAYDETDAFILEWDPSDGSHSSFDRPTPCDAAGVFDLESPYFWLNCGPRAILYEEAAELIFAESYDALEAAPNGGVVALDVGDPSVVGLLTRESGTLVNLPELPASASVSDMADDGSGGTLVLYSTPCAGDCALDPAEPAYTGVAPIVDFWLTRFDSEAVYDAAYGTVELGTGPMTDTAALRANDGVAVVSFPPRSDEGLQERWALVGSDGSLDPTFGSEYADRPPGFVDMEFNGTEIAEIGWYTIVEPSHMTLRFWHLTDQGTFFDDSGLFEVDIEAFAAAGITLGCNADGTLFCPDDVVTRAQMASFIARWLDLELTAPDLFSDDDGSTHEASINAIAQAGITLGCSTADTTLFCPDDVVTRAQMASFIKRALGLPDDFTDRFTDDDGSPHETSIDAIATAGITLGCDETGLLYCPNEGVARKHMAAFIVRAGVDS